MKKKVYFSTRIAIYFTSTCQLQSPYFRIDFIRLVQYTQLDIRERSLSNPLLLALSSVFHPCSDSAVIATAIHFFHKNLALTAPAV